MHNSEYNVAKKQVVTKAAARQSASWSTVEN